MYKLPWLGEQVKNILKFVSDTLMGKITLNNNNIYFSNSDLEISQGHTLKGVGASDWSYIKRQNASATETLQDVIDNINATINYVAPEINSFTVSPSATQYEIGTTISANGLTFNWTLNKNVISITFDGIDGSTLPVSARSAKNTSALSSAKTFTLTVSDGKNNATATKVISFLPKVYYGASSKTTLSSSEINALSGTLKSSKAGSYSITAGAGQYGYLCVPKSYGTPSVKIGGFDTELVSVGVVSHTNASGKRQDYNVYRTSQAGLGTFTMVVS